MQQDGRRKNGGAVEATLKAQAEGLGMMAWVGAAMMDHVRRTSSELAGFARDQARQDLDTLSGMLTCGSPERAAKMQGAYIEAKMSALVEEAERLGRMHADMCETTHKRLTDWQE
ncbi:hypothetical protein RGUI_3445 [Rhodovulum sp. P5]|uniref:hypothetical protein n=1 Tax=Rhodovulum sp. P5 TaxID=1564506 RepID=UPI0009C309C1|nr:hypothetical protein [Rhodovulum sp. P5]ARE41586.1 hypothetical protein RGUI_3445 [Rhodovulum sp. P5]